MGEIVYFEPRQALDAKDNLDAFIRYCRDELYVFGADLNWDDDYWREPGITFSNLNQKTRPGADAVVAHPLSEPFKNFAKAYLRYQQGVRPTKAMLEVPALRVLERALVEVNGNSDLSGLNLVVADQAGVITGEHYAPSRAYRVGGAVAKLIGFIGVYGFIPARLDWKNPLSRPLDTVRTGKKAKQEREKKLPDPEALNALASLFASNPSEPRDIFTTSTAALLLCASSRISEILSLREDCEVWEKRRDGRIGYGWRFMPLKGANPYIKWIPAPMVEVAQEAIRRLRQLTEEGRRIAEWHERHPDEFYRHPGCPDVMEDQPLTIEQSADALAIEGSADYRRDRLKALGLSSKGGGNTLRRLNRVVREKLPKGFPIFDEKSDLRYSEALFCFQDLQLRTDMAESPCRVWRPGPGTLNDDLGSGRLKTVRSIFDRHRLNEGRKSPLKARSHQFRHLLDTLLQRGGLGQAEIARWAGRADIRQNRVYDHMDEFELADMIRQQDPALRIAPSTEELAEQVAKKLPMTTQEFNALEMPTAHITEFGFCGHDYSMSPCQRFKDCINCTEHVCVKGDRRIDRIKELYGVVNSQVERAEVEIADGIAGADRWYEVHKQAQVRYRELIRLYEDLRVPNGSMIRLRNPNEFSPHRRAVEAKASRGEITDDERRLLTGVPVSLEGSDGSSS